MTTANVGAANAKVFPPIGRCIYCGSDGGGKLTKEHIFPQGLGGGLILPRASCKACQTEIHIFETICMRQTLLPFRKNTGLIRHPNDLPVTVPLTFDLELQGPTQVELDLHPNVVVLPGLRDVPGILQGHAQQPLIQFNHRIFGGLEILEETKRKLQEKKFIGINIDGYAWVRMLAKIAHGYAFAELGPRRFTPVLPDLILGRNPRLASYLIGKCPMPFSIPSDPPLFMIEMKSVEVKMENKAPQRFAAVNMRLFAELGAEAPVYTAIAGTLTDVDIETADIES